MFTKKTLFLFFIGLIFITQLSSQIGFNAGIKGGIHSFEVPSAQGILVGDQTINFLDSPLGFQFGLYGRLDLSLISIEMRAMLHSTSVNYTLNGSNGSVIENIRSESFNSLDIPLLVGFEVLFFDLFVGPVAHLNINSTSELLEFDGGIISQFSTAEYGWRAGFGTAIDRFNLALEYEGNFSRFGNHLSIGDRQFDFGNSPRRLLITFGIEII